MRTAAENVTAEEIERDVARLISQWEQISALAAKQKRPGLVYREPEMAVRFIREEFNAEYRAVMIDDVALYDDIKDYADAVAPGAERAGASSTTRRRSPFRSSSGSTWWSRSRRRWTGRCGCRRADR